VSATFRYAGLNEYQRVRKFLNDHWAQRHIYVRDRALFDWTFHGHGWFEGDEWAGDDEGRYTFVIAEDNGEMVGALGGIPFELNCYGRTMRGVWIANYVIRPDHRKGPTALQLVGTFRRPPFVSVIAAGLNPATVLIYRVLRGLVLPAIPRHIALLPGAAKRTAVLIHLAHPEWSAAKADDLALHFELPSLREPFHAGCRIPDNWDSHNWLDLAQRTVGAARNLRYLNWRYLKHPTFRYRVVTVPDGPRTGLAIWRLEPITTETEGRRVEIEKIGRLVEFLPASESNAIALAGAVLSQAAEQQAIGVDFYGYHGLCRAWLEQAGFLAVDSHPEGMAIPSRFQPLDGHDGSILAAMFVMGDLPPCTGGANCSWYWTKSDSDQDRPN